MGEALTVIAHVVVSDFPFESTTFTVKPKVPVFVGVPEMFPVDELSERPLGSDPDMIENVYPGVPPVAISASV